MHVAGDSVLVPQSGTTTIATLKEGCRPAVEAAALVGVSGGSWVVLRTRVTGEVDLYQVYASGDVTLGTLNASICFAVA